MTMPPGDSSPTKRNLPYRKRELIGVGASAEVLRADDPELERTVAIKVQYAGASRSETDSFVCEARTTAQLEHPNIVPVYALGRDDQGRLCIAMKELKGATLTEIVQNATDWPSRAYFLRVVRTILHAADALIFAHARGFVHLDVKPDNILVGDHGETYLLDWGFAREPRDGNAHGPNPDAPPADAIVGTPRFMAPEQAAGNSDTVDRRTDVFCLGATLYFAVTRQAPYEAPTIADSLEAALNGQYADPELVHDGVAVPRELCAIIRRAMSIQVGERYAQVADMSADLERYLHDGDRVTLRSYRAGETIVTEGEEAHDAFRILSGACHVTRRAADADVLLRTMGPGEPFGEAAIFGRSRRSATVVAHTDVTVEVMGRSDVEAWLEGDGWIAPFVRALANRFVNVEQARDKADLEAATWRVAATILATIQRDPERTWSSLRAEMHARGGHVADVIDEGLARSGLTLVGDRLVFSASS